MNYMNEYIKREDAKKKARAVRTCCNNNGEFEYTSAVLVDDLDAILAADVIENAKRTTFELDAARDLKDFVHACEIDNSIMDGFCADRIRTYLYALIDEATIGFDWSNDAGESVDDWPDWKKRAALCNYQIAP